MKLLWTDPDVALVCSLGDAAEKYAAEGADGMSKSSIDPS